MTCPHCNKEIDNNAQFCKHCGKIIPAQQIKQPPKRHSSCLIAALFIIPTAIILIVAITLCVSFVVGNNIKESKFLDTLETYQLSTPTPYPTPTLTPKSTPTPTIEAVIPTIAPTELPIIPNPKSISLDINNNTEYLFPSDTVIITDEFLASCSKETIRYIRNEIYAKHGRQFDDPTLQAYFSSKSWYSPVSNFNDNDKSIFSAIEFQNLEIISLYEQKMGWR